MPVRSTPQYWFGRFLIGLALLAVAGSGTITRLIRDPMGIATLAVGLYGFWTALTSVRPLITLASLRARTRTKWNESAQADFARASLPRRIFYLLVAVAESDGPMTRDEREVVRHFLLQRFSDPITAREIQSWETQPLPIQDRMGLAARISVGLDDAELDTLFCWCALVAFADGKFRADEHAALNDVAKGLGILGPRARMLFHLARAQFLAANPQFAGDDERARNHQRYRQQQSQAARPAGSRAHALEVLGLEQGATVDQIRKRHRELVRKFHPDAQPNLGPVAQKEATERFTAIQRAYETLTANA